MMPEEGTDSLQLELGKVVSSHVNAGDQTRYAEPSLQYLKLLLLRVNYNASHLVKKNPTTNIQN